MTFIVAQPMLTSPICDTDEKPITYLKSDWTEAQFLHHARRYPIGPFKQSWWDAEECHLAVRDAVYDCALGYFNALKVGNTKKLVEDIIRHAPVEWSQPILTGTGKGIEEARIKDLSS